MATILEMMTALQEEFSRSFLDAINENDPESIKKAKAKAWHCFLQLGLPAAGNEAFQYLHLQALFQQRFSQVTVSQSVTRESFASAILEECRESYFVFVDGHFVPELSNRSGLPQSVVVLPMKQAARTYGALLQNGWAQSLKEEQDPFAILNLACYQDGCFLYVPPKVIVEKSVQFLHIISAEAIEKKSWIMPRLELFQGMHSELTIANTLLWNGSGSCFYNGMSNITLEEGAHCTYLQDTLALGDTVGWFFDAVRATLKRSALLKNMHLSNGKALTRRSIHVELTGENSEVALRGISFLKESREAHVDIMVRHEAPHTRSLQLFKHILTGKARASFQGKIYVEKEAQKTEAYQLNNNLLLSDQAESNSRPNLEIFADDVKATHGATFGQLNEEQILYLQTRGISKQDAKKYLIMGFCKEVIDMLPIASLRQAALCHASRDIYIS